MSPKKRMPADTGFIINVDDDKDTADLIDRLIRSATGHPTQTFSDPLAAVDFCSANSSKIGLIITNGIMPGIDGFKLLDAVDCLLNSSVPAILISGHWQNDSTKIDCFYSLKMKNVRPVRFFGKPFNPSEFIETVKSAILV